jgi:hypothetical protein
MKSKSQLLLLGKSVRLDLEHMKDETHSELVLKLKEEGYVVNSIDRDRLTLDYLQNPSSVSNYDLVVYDTASNLYSFDDEGQRRSERFRDLVADQLKAMRVPILVLADPYVTDEVSKTVKEYEFMGINQPYSIDAVIDKIKKI